MPRRDLRSKRGDCFYCSRPSTNRCDKCKLVFYCSKEHYSFHRQRDYCFPFRVLWKQTTGISVVATRDIQPLELILYEWNLIVGPRQLRAGENVVCVECLKVLDSTNEKNCGMCEMPICSDQCQVGVNHYTECQVFRNLGRSSSYNDLAFKLAAVVPLRLLLKVKEENSKGFSRLKFLIDTQTSSPSSFLNDDDISTKRMPTMFHSDILKWTKDKKKMVNFIKKVLNVSRENSNSKSKNHESTYTNDDDEDPDNIGKIIDILRRFSMASSQQSWYSGATPPGSGTAFFPTFSLFQHSCISNAKFFIYPDNNLAIQAQRPISAGEEITVSRVQTLEPTWKRRAKLYRDHLIICKCKRCEDPTELGSFMSALKCPKCDNTEEFEEERISTTQNSKLENIERKMKKGCIVPNNPLDFNSAWSCTVHRQIKICGKNAQQIQLDLQIDLYKDGLLTTIPRLHSKIFQFLEYLHPTHGLIMTAKRSLVQCYSQLSADSVNRRQLELIRNLCQQQIDTMDSVDPGLPDWKGNILKHLSAAQLNLARMDMEEKRIPRNEFLLRVKKAMLLVQEGVRCKSCVKINRTNKNEGPDENSSKFDDLVDEMSDSSYDSSYLSDSSYSLSLH